MKKRSKLSLLGGFFLSVCGLLLLLIFKWLYVSIIIIIIGLSITILGFILDVVKKKEDIPEEAVLLCKMCHTERLKEALYCSSCGYEFKEDNL